MNAVYVPTAIDAEQSVLGGLMIDPGALVRVAGWLEASDFYREDHRLIYSAICGLVERKSPCDAITMGDWFHANAFDVDPTYLMELHSNTPSAYNVVAYAEIVVEKAKLRAVMDVASKVIESATRHGASSDTVIGEAASTLANMNATKLRGGLESSKSALGRVFQRMSDRYAIAEAGEATLPGLPWPWKALNDVTKGIRPGVLYVIGARPNMGKSVFGVQAGVFNAVRGRNVALFSVEMGADELVTRAISSLAMVPHAWVDDPSPSLAGEDTEVHWNRVTGAFTALLDNPMLIDETPGITIDQLMARARRAHMHKPLDLIIIDHMHDMGLDKAKEVRHEYGRITQGAKTLAKELGCPVILMAQLNRKSAEGGGRPKMTDLRESGEIEQKADVIMFLHRDDYYDPGCDRRGLVDVILAKGRNIRTGQDVELVNCYSEMRLKDADEWERPEPSLTERCSPKVTGFRGRK